MNFAPGSNFIRLLPPEGQAWDRYHRLVPQEAAKRVEHAAELWKTCPMCVREAVQGISDFIEWVVNPPRA